MKANSPKSKPKLKFEWTDIPARPLSTILEEILIELRKIREAMEKTGTYPVPNYPVYPNNQPPWNPDIPPSPFPTPWTPVWYCSDGTKWEPPASPWHPTGYTLSSVTNAPGTMATPPGEYCDSSGEGLRPKDCFTKKELEDKFGVKK
jgi:hypothetical protein